MKRSLAILLSLLVVIAFMPAMTFADDTISIEKQEVLSNGISVKVTLNTSDFEIDKIVQWGGDEYELKDGDYKVSGKSIIFTKAFLQGDTGYAPYDPKWSFQIFFNNGDSVITKDIKSYNISGLAGATVRNFVYNGKQKSIGSPGLSGNLKKGRDYKIVYSKSKRKAIGHYKYTVIGIGKYKGRQKGSFNIIPKKPKISSAKRTKSKATIKWKKVKNCSGYVVTLCKWHVEADDDGDGGWYVKYKSSTVKGKSKVKKVFKNVKKSKYDVVQIRAYKTVNGKKIYSNTRIKEFK